MSTRAPLPRWMQARAVPELDFTRNEDAETVRELLRPDDLPPNHPVWRWWHDSIGTGRFHIQHIASDLRLLRNVPGFKRLVRQLRNNPAGFWDFRLELRLAGSLARFEGQEVTNLAGDGPGADVEAVVRSGHRCGFACFRASSAPPFLQQLETDADKLLRACTAAVVARATAPQLLAITLPSVPFRQQDPDVVRKLVRRILVETDKGAIEDDGIRISRHELSTPPTTGVCVRLRLQLPALGWEEQRIKEIAHEKARREAKSWAANYEGVPMFVLEESHFGHGVRNELEGILDTTPAFKGIVSTYPGFSDGGGALNGMEEWSFALRSPGLDIGINTFGDNLDSWAAGHAAIEWAEASVRGEWEVLRRAALNERRQVHPFMLMRRRSRIPFPDPAAQEVDEEMTQKAVAAAIELRRESEKSLK